MNACLIREFRVLSLVWVIQTTTQMSGNMTCAIPATVKNIKELWKRLTGQLPQTFCCCQSSSILFYFLKNSLSLGIKGATIMSFVAVSTFSQVWDAWRLWKAAIQLFPQSDFRALLSEGSSSSVFEIFHLCWIETAMLLPKLMQLHKKCTTWWDHDLNPLTEFE